MINSHLHPSYPATPSILEIAAARRPGYRALDEFRAGRKEEKRDAPPNAPAAVAALKKTAALIPSSLFRYHSERRWLTLGNNPASLKLCVVGVGAAGGRRRRCQPKREDTATRADDAPEQESDGQQAPVGRDEPLGEHHNSPVARKTKSCGASGVRSRRTDKKRARAPQDHNSGQEPPRAQKLEHNVRERLKERVWDEKNGLKVARVSQKSYRKGKNETHKAEQILLIGESEVLR